MVMNGFQRAHAQAQSICLSVLVSCEFYAWIVFCTFAAQTVRATPHATRDGVGPCHVHIHDGVSWLSDVLRIH